jgi:hypothetical protein
VPKRLSPKRYLVSGDCTPKCSVSKESLGEEAFSLVHGLYEQGLNDWKMEERLRAVNVMLSHGSIGRHRKLHLIEADSVTEDPELAELDDVAALEHILKQGQKQIRSWKVTPSEYFKAMELKYRLTQGSTNDAMFAALASGAAEEDDPTGPEEDDEPLEGTE